MFRYFESLVDPYVAYPENDSPPQTLSAFLWAYMVPFRTVFIICGIAAAVIAAVEVLLVAYLGRLVNILGAGTPENVWANHGAEFILVGLAMLFLRPVVYLVHTMLLNQTILPNIGTLVRWRAHRHVLRQSVGWFENDFAGRIANRVMQTPPATGSVAFQIFDAFAFAGAYVIAAAFLLAQAETTLLIPLLLWLVPYLLLMRWVVLKVTPASQAFSDARSAVSGKVVDSYTNIHSVKMFAQNDREMAYAKDSIEHTRQTFQVELRLFTLMDAGLTILNGLLIVGLVGWALFLWMQGNHEVGLVAAATAIVLRLQAMSGWIMGAISNFYQELGVIREGMQTIAQPIALVDRPDARALQVTEGEVVFDDLTHHYGRQTGGLDHVSVIVKPGEKIGLVGQSGAGKSTLVKLLLRFYDVESGAIRIDGQSIDAVTQDSLRAAIGMVQQDSALLHRSVRENILYGRDDALEEAMIAAAKQAAAHEFILELEDSEGRTGYDAKVGERGVKLSGGQRQRIALARVILKDAPILVLDEATSALDSEVEAEILETLYQMMDGKTVIAIAHRLSTIAQMDRILVLDAGRVVEDGSHEALLAKGGIYARFWQRQSGGFLDVA
ncbi:MAG: ABC transporter ATP-binding protein [Pseudomonadota bacterium]